MLKGIFIVCLAGGVLFADYLDSIPVTRWIDPYGRQPGTFEEWISENPYLFSFSAGIIKKGLFLGRVTTQRRTK